MSDLAKKKNASGNGRFLIVVSIILILLSCIMLVFWYQKNVEEDNDIEKVVEKLDLEDVKLEYHDFVKVMDGASLYVKEEAGAKAIATVHGEIEISLDSSFDVVDEYFKLLDSD